MYVCIYLFNFFGFDSFSVKSKMIKKTIHAFQTTEKNQGNMVRKCGMHFCVTF